MGFTSAWAISGHPDSFIAELSPRLLPAMEADRRRHGAQDGWRRWQRAPLPDCATWYAPPGTPAAIAAVHAAVDSFLELTAPGQHVDAVCDGTADPLFYVVDDVWAGQAQEDMFLSVHSKEYPVASSSMPSVRPGRPSCRAGAGTSC